MPAVEFLGTPEETPELARLANDGMAEIAQQHPGAVSGLRRLAADEQRAGGAGGDGPRDRQARRQGHADLHQRQRPAARRPGVLPHLRAHEQRPTTCRSGCTRRAPRNSPIIRPSRNRKYEMWWLFGWPYETSVVHGADGVLGHVRQAAQAARSSRTTSARWCRSSRNRVGYGMDQFGSRTSDEDYEGLRKSMKKRPVDYFKMFYNDTSINGWASGIRCGLDFFGVQARAVRHRLPVRSAGRAAVHPRDHQGARRHEAQARRQARASTSATRWRCSS